MKNNFLQLLIIFMLMMFNFSALGSTSNSFLPYNFYIGAQIGVSNLHLEDFFTDDEKIHDKGLGGRLFWGSHLSPNFDIELGFTHYKSPTIAGYYSTISFNENSVDLVVKAFLPVSPEMSFYVKGGIAELILDHFKVESWYGVNNIEGYDSSVRPILGAGINYNFNTKLSGEITLQRILGNREYTHADFFGVGLVFKL